MRIRHLFSILILPALLTSACGEYDFKVNDRVVYTPAQLFTDFDIPDQGLSDCVQQTITDQVVTAASQLTDLVCTNAGISDLTGLSRFNSLLKIRLSNNEVRNLMELQAMVQLQELYLDNNQVIDPVPLYQLQLLRFIDLSKNPNLQCPRQTGLSWVGDVTLPAHCR